MRVQIIKNQHELHTCPAFSIGHLLWGTKTLPPTYGRIGFLPSTGFLIEMTCEEADPRRTHTENNSPVYKDSAMEAFFQFFPDGKSNGIYLNFEMNANGALLAMYGASRTDRTMFTADQIQRCHCDAHISEASWSVSLTVPLSILEEIYGDLFLTEGSSFSCNFYKLAEDSDIEHFASYAPVISEVPNFHKPECFEPSTLTSLL